MSRYSTFEINLDEAGAIETAAAEIIDKVTGEITAGKSKPLGAYELDELYGYKLINKAAYIQLALAHDFGVMGNPNLSSDECEDFANRWSREPNEITASDMRKAIDKILAAQFKNEPENDKFPQLNLFD